MPSPDRPRPAARAASKPAASSAKPQMEKPDAAVLARLDAAMADLPVYRRPMFGTVSWFVESNAQMFAGVWGAAINVRLGEAEARQAVASGAARPFEPMAGRAMREYVLVDAASLRPAAFNRWIERALEFASTLERKKGK